MHMRLPKFIITHHDHVYTLRRIGLAGMIFELRAPVSQIKHMFTKLKI